jgi:hypothetical protein
MHFPDVPPTADNLTRFVTMLLSDCGAVGLAFRNQVQPQKSPDGGSLILAGPHTDSTGIDHSRLHFQYIGDINRRTLPRVALGTSKIIVQGFEPWFWVAEQLKNHPSNHIMAGPFRPEHKASVDEMLRTMLPPSVVIVADSGRK